MGKSVIVKLIFASIFLLAPTLATAQDGNGGIPVDDPPLPPHLIPYQRPFSVFYDETCNMLTIRFNGSVEDAFISIYKDDLLIDSENLPTLFPGTIFTFTLTQSGLYTAYIKIGEVEYLVFNEEFE